MLKPFLENLFSNTEDVKNGCLYRGFVQINEIYCYYDKCIYEEFRSFISTNAKDLKSFKKLLEILRKFKNFMKKKEYKELKGILAASIEEKTAKLFVLYNNNETYIKTLESVFSLIQQNMMDDAKELCEKYKITTFKQCLESYIQLVDAKKLKNSETLIGDTMVALYKTKNLPKTEIQELKLKISSYPKTLKSREETLRQIVQLNDLNAKDSVRIEKMITTLYESFQKIKFKSPISNTNINFEMICFGSFINGFSINNSDVDCTILTNSFMEERSLLGYLSVALNSLKPEDFEFLCLNNKQIRIPILKIHSDQLGEMDLAINNVLGVANSKLLKVYSEINEKCQTLGKLVKIWGKSNNLIGPSIMSSYGYIVMVIYFLQLKRMLPSLQVIAKKKRLANKTKPPLLKIKRKVKNLEVEEFDTIIEFETDQMEIKKYMQENQYPINTQGIFELFLEFMKFYSRMGLFRRLKMRCNIKKGVVDLKRSDNDSCLFSIVDPFDEMHNPGMRLKMDTHAADCERTLTVIDNTIRCLDTTEPDFKAAFNFR